MRALDDADLFELLRSRVKSAGGQSAFARQHGVERTYLNTVLSGKKPIGGPSILDALNLSIGYAPVEWRDRADARAVDHNGVLELLNSRVKSAYVPLATKVQCSRIAPSTMILAPYSQQRTAEW